MLRLEIPAAAHDGDCRAADVAAEPAHVKLGLLRRSDAPATPGPMGSSHGL